jgi:hypothetical protein
MDKQTLSKFLTRHVLAAESAKHWTSLRFPREVHRCLSALDEVHINFKSNHIIFILLSSHIGTYVGVLK